MALSKSFRGSSEGLVTQDLLGGKNTSRGRAEVSEDVLGFIVNQLTDAYVDPLQAALREVVSNAVDATAMAGKRTPVKITLPSPLSPNLVVEDFGTGMSLDQVKTNYVMYGSSTKVNNFEQIGEYGLGAKAPLAFTRRYMVETSKDGFTTVFSMSREGDGIFFYILDHRQTNHADGTKVTIPAPRQADQSRLKSLASHFVNLEDNISLEIDGTVEPHDLLLLTDQLVLDKDSGTTGSIWVDEPTLKALTKAVIFNEHPRSITASEFELAGWIYPAHIGMGRILVQLKPGVVDFSSSREAIMKNERLVALEQAVHIYFTNDAAKDLVGLLPTLKDEQLWWLFNVFAPADMTVEGGKFVRYDKDPGPRNYWPEFLTPEMWKSEVTGFNPSDILDATKVQDFNPLSIIVCHTRPGKTEWGQLTSGQYYSDLSGVYIKDLNKVVGPQLRGENKSQASMLKYFKDLRMWRIPTTEFIEAPFFVICEVSKDQQPEPLLTRAGNLVNVGEGQYATVVLTDQDVDTAKKYFRSIEKYFSSEVSFMTRDEVYSTAAANQPKKPPKKDASFRAATAKWDYKDRTLTHPNNSIRIDFNLSYPKENPDSVLVVCSNSPYSNPFGRPAIVGAINKGVVGENEDVEFLQVSNSEVTLALLEAFGSRRVLFVSDLKHRSKTARSWARNSTFSARHLHSTLDRLDKVEVFSRVLLLGYAGRLQSRVSLIQKMAPNDLPEEQQEVFDLMQQAAERTPKNDFSPELNSLDYESLVHIFGKKKYAYAKRVAALCLGELTDRYGYYSPSKETKDDKLLFMSLLGDLDSLTLIQETLPDNLKQAHNDIVRAKMKAYLS